MQGSVTVGSHYFPCLEGKRTELFGGRARWKGSPPTALVQPLAEQAVVPAVKWKTSSLLLEARGQGSGGVEGRPRGCH